MRMLASKCYRVSKVLNKFSQFTHFIDMQLYQLHKVHKQAQMKAEKEEINKYAKKVFINFSFHLSRF